jgi:hypothetical protein
MPTKTSPRFLSFSPFSTVIRGHDETVSTLRPVFYITGVGNVRDVIPFSRTPGKVRF